MRHYHFRAGNADAESGEGGFAGVLGQDVRTSEVARARCASAFGRDRVIAQLNSCAPLAHVFTDFTGEIQRLQCLALPLQGHDAGGEALLARGGDIDSGMALISALRVGGAGEGGNVLIDGRLHTPPDRLDPRAGNRA